MPCDGHCYDVPALEALSSHSSSQEEIEASQVLPGRHHEQLEAYSYGPLKPAQTRILRLHPKGHSPEGGLRDNGLYADLVTVNLHILEGAMIDGTTQNIHYDALTYSWGHPEPSETLIIGGKAKPISRQNATALIALRHPTQIANFWVDAICINQDDKQEKSEQVAHMLAIYKKARSVTAWLGSPDSNSLLAFACARKLPALKAGLSEHRELAHNGSCIDQFTAIHNAIFHLFERPWLGRTWIRQEIYGARRLTVQCGLNSVSWKDFMRLADLMSTIRPFMGTYKNYQRIKRLLEEARVNAEVPRNGVKQPRDILEVLLGSRDFKYTDPRDTFYAALGMCNIETSANPRSYGGQRRVVPVDYRKSLGEVYTDATLHIISRHDRLSDLAAIWNNNYRRTNLHSEGLSTWAIDWRSCENAYDCSGDSDIWRPLSPMRNMEDSYGSKATEWPEDKEWHWPEPLPKDHAALLLKVRILDYVAHLTDYTCHPWEMRESDMFSFAPLPALNLKTLLFAQPRKFQHGVHSWRIAILGITDTSRICLVPSSVAEGDLVVAVAPTLLPMVIRPKGCSSAAAGLYTEDDSNGAASLIKNSTRGHTARLFTIWYYIKSALDVCTLVLNFCMCISALTSRQVIAALLIVGFGGDLVVAAVYTIGHYIVAVSFLCTLILISITCIWAFGFTQANSTLLIIGFGGILALLLAGHLTCTYVYVYSESFSSHRKSHSPVISEFWPRSALCSFLFGILASAGASPLLSVYFASTLAMFFISNFWLRSSEMPTNIRREKVRELLDNLVESTGPDYDFHGPLIVRVPGAGNVPRGSNFSSEGVWKRSIQEIKLH
jgi:hypothetical protein